MVRLLAPVRIRGTFGKALSFDGVDDYVEVPDSASLNPTEEITVMGWFYLKGPTGDIQNGVRKQDQYLIFWIDSGYSKVAVYVKRTDAVWKSLTIANPKAVEGKWVHVAMTYKSNGEFKGYLNGELAASTTLSALPINVTDNPLQIGREPPGFFFKGTIDEVRIYNRALSAEEIIQLFRGGHVWKGLVLWLRFDEGSGTTAGDSSGCGNHGTIYGATWTNGAMILRKPVR